MVILAIIVMHALFCDHCSAIIVLQTLLCNHCYAIWILVTENDLAGAKPEKLLVYLKWPGRRTTTREKLSVPKMAKLEFKISKKTTGAPYRGPRREQAEEATAQDSYLGDAVRVPKCKRCLESFFLAEIL